LTSALRITEPPTKTPAHAKATGQLRLTNAVSGFDLLDPISAAVLFLLANFFTVTYTPLIQLLTYNSGSSNLSK